MADPRKREPHETEPRPPVAVEGALRQRAREDPVALGTALAPAFGCALRHAIIGSVSRSLHRLNRLLLYTVSWQGLKWRFEALWTGKPYADVVHSHVLVQPMRQVFLIHRRSGLLLCQVGDAVERPQDGDLVSSMLTAIQDFVSDSFSAGTTGSLDTIQVGKTTLCVEQGPQAVLAGILDGPVSLQLRRTVRHGLLGIHRQFASELAAFDGDDAPFDATSKRLEELLHTQIPIEDRLLPLTWLVVLLPFAALLAWGLIHHRAGEHWDATVDRLRAEPGIVVLTENRSRGHYQVSGLRDPLSLDPHAIIVSSPLRTDRITHTWTPFFDSTPRIVLKRARHLLHPPETVTLDYGQWVLRVRGKATSAWLNRARMIAPLIPGVAETDFSAVTEMGDKIRQQWQRALFRISRSPGVVVLDSGHHDDGTPYVRGLRDPLVPHPADTLRAAGINTESVDMQWDPYHSGRPELALARARNVLLPPRGVSLSLAGGTLVASGKAPNAWIRRAHALAPVLMGVERLDADDTEDLDKTALKQIRISVERHVFQLLPGQPDPAPGQDGKLEALVADLQSLTRQARALGQEPSVEIRGHAPATGDVGTDQATSLLYAQSFRARLQHRRVDSSILAPRGMGSTPPTQTASGRSARHGAISLRVHLAATPTPPTPLVP